MKKTQIKKIKLINKFDDNITKHILQYINLKCKTCHVKILNFKKTISYKNVIFCCKECYLFI